MSVRSLFSSPLRLGYTPGAFSQTKGSMFDHSDATDVGRLSVGTKYYISCGTER
jgi:hypothetical protein